MQVGPGSGCRGDNCGRPSHGEADKVFSHPIKDWPISQEVWSRKLKHAKLEEVEIALLYPTQDTIEKEGVERYKDGYEDVPEVLSYKGKLLIADGHHRIVSDMLKGKTKIKVLLA